MQQDEKPALTDLTSLANQPPAEGASQPAQEKETTATDVSAPLHTVDNGSEVIDRQYVEMARHIIENNRSNPHAQQQELAKLKAEYLKKRFNRDLKISDD